MSIHVITNFNANCKICAVSDDDHIEAMIEGTTHDAMSALTHLIAHTIYDSADSYKDNKELLEKVGLEYDGVNVTAKDSLVIYLWKKLQDSVNEELCTLKIKEKLNLPEELGGLPNQIAKGIADAIIDFAKGKAKEAAEDNE